MDDIFEAILEIIWGVLDDSYDSGNRKKRKKLLVLTTLIGISLLLILFVVGIVERNADLIAGCALLLIVLLIWLILKIREYRKYH